MIFKARIIFSILVVFIHLLVSAKSVELFSDKNFTKNYNSKVKPDNVQQGDILKVHEHDFEVLSFLGKGNTTYVYEVRQQGRSGTFALRVPKKSGSFNSTYTYSEFISMTIKGYQLLEEQGVPIPKIYEYYNENYILTERLYPQFTLTEFISNFETKSFSQTHKLTFDLAKNSLADFLKTMSGFTKIGDFRFDQVVYDKEKGWVLLDWTDGHSLVNNYLNDKEPFLFNSSNIMNFSKAKRNYLQEMINNIKEYRKDREVVFEKYMDELTSLFETSDLNIDELLAFHSQIPSWIFSYSKYRARISILITDVLSQDLPFFDKFAVFARYGNSSLWRFNKIIFRNDVSVLDYLKEFHRYKDFIEKEYWSSLHQNYLSVKLSKVQSSTEMIKLFEVFNKESTDFDVDTKEVFRGMRKKVQKLTSELKTTDEELDLLSEFIPRPISFLHSCQKYIRSFF